MSSSRSRTERRECLSAERSSQASYIVQSAQRGQIPHWHKKQGGWGAVALPSYQPSGPKLRKIFILLDLDILKFVM